MTQAVVDAAMHRFSVVVYDGAFLTKNGVSQKDLIRYSAATFALLENALCAIAENFLKDGEAASMHGSIRSSFAGFSEKFAPFPVVSSDDLVSADSELSAICEFMRTLNKPISVEDLKLVKADFTKWFILIQTPRFSCFRTLLITEAKNDLRQALALAYSLWFYGLNLNDEKWSFACRIADVAANSAEQAVTDVFGKG